ncbi:MAG: SPOR domain-containing protein [Campylobacterota bacterium]|nr:SPOR domain-containing protein [Campylobacterota bacterium]
MNDHNLDDLIIDNMEPNQRKTKNFLTIIALFIVFLIVGIILAKFYTKESTSAPLILEEDTIEIIAPELKLQAPQKTDEIKEETSLSKIIEQEIKAPEIKSKEAAKVEKPIKPIVKEKVDQAIEVEAIKETVQITEEYTQKPEAIEIPKPIVKKTPEPKPKPIIKKEIPKPSKPVTPPKKTVKNTANGRYFIQVGSFKQSPSSRFLSVIKKSGFNYRITKPSSKGTKKLLIGPYPSRASVDTALIRVRDRINKQAFVVKR